MYKKLLLILSAALLISPTAYCGRASVRCVKEIENCKKAQDTKRVIPGFEDIKLVHEALDVLEYQYKKASTNRQTLAIRLRLILMLTEFADAIPFMSLTIKEIPGLNGNDYMKGFPWGLKPGDLIFLTEQDCPESYSLAKKHASSMGLDMSPTILLSRAKDIEQSPAANLLQACGCILVPEKMLKSNMNDSELEGFMVHQLAGIKQSYKAIGFAATFLESNATRLLANVALGMTIYKIFKKAPSSDNVTGIKYYAKLGKNWTEERNFFIRNLIKLTPNAAFNFLWARALRQIEKDTDRAAAYNTKATNALIDYIKFENNREAFNMELWTTAKERINDSEMNGFNKLASKSLLNLLYWKFRVMSYLFSTDTDKDERVKCLETKLKRYQPIENVEPIDADPIIDIA
ncbi:hypothetical protein A3F06_03770 [candidate division TM6 bacterium RIFCSPHIGHO2_12_FULL_36_22]|nr:MAG: hypothetical protein A3F06_03770 [candidate division TM6 bacterium RIFCSPHIGHO2_12_FULL_36_22]